MQKISATFISILIWLFFVITITAGILMCADNILSQEQDLTFGFAMVGATYFGVFVSIPISASLSFFCYKQITSIPDKLDAALYFRRNFAKNSFISLFKQILSLIISGIVFFGYVIILTTLLIFTTKAIDSQNRFVSAAGYLFVFIDWFSLGLALPLAMLVHKQLTKNGRKDV